MSDESLITIQVKLYATLTKYVGRSIMHEPMGVNLVKGATLATLYDRLGIPGDEVKTVFVNSKMQSDGYVLCDGDHVGVFPPVGGG